MYVDKDPFCLMQFESIYQNDYDLTLTHCPYRALNLLSVEQDFSFLIADFDLPDMAVSIFAQRVKSKIPELTILALVTAASGGQSQDLKTTSAIDHLLEKPFKKTELMSIMAEPTKVTDSLRVS